VVVQQPHLAGLETGTALAVSGFPRSLQVNVKTAELHLALVQNSVAFHVGVGAWIALSV